jgi:hypothetical protein
VKVFWRVDGEKCDKSLIIIIII